MYGKNAYVKYEMLVNGYGHCYSFLRIMIE